MAEITTEPLDGLLADVLEELAANDDVATQKRIDGYLKSAMARLQDIAGAPLDFTMPGLARDLLMARCRYANSQALEMFEKNFASELLTLNLTSQVVVPDEAENADGISDL